MGVSSRIVWMALCNIRLRERLLMESYILNYSIRHNFEYDRVEGNELLHQCAIVEDQIGKMVLTLEDGRRIITNSFPETNCITGVKSVLELIKPFDGCWRDIPNSEYRYRWSANA